MQWTAGFELDKMEKIFGLLGVSSVLSLQVLTLTLIPLLSGVVPLNRGATVPPVALLGIEDPVPADFLVGTWKFSDEFCRWGATDKEKAKLKTFRGHSTMELRTDGTMSMVNFFVPAKGRWEVSRQGLVIHDPDFPERGSQILPVRKRDANRIWILLPFSGGSVGIGMRRLAEGETARKRPEKKKQKIETYSLGSEILSTLENNEAHPDEQRELDSQLEP